jgi:hypothetical protein
MIKEMIIRTALNAKFGRYGKVLTLKIDSSNKTIDVDVLLKGETEPIKIRVGQYEIRKEGKPGLALTNIQTSRPWMTELAAAFGPEILIPIEKAKLLGLVL